MQESVLRSSSLRVAFPSKPKSQQGYDALARNVNALANQNKLTCRVQTAELDWLLEIRGRNQNRFLRRETLC